MQEVGHPPAAPPEWRVWLAPLRAHPGQRRGTDPDAPVVEPEYEHDLLDRVGDQRQRVRAEDRQGEALGQQGLAETVAVTAAGGDSRRWVRSADARLLASLGELA